MNEESLATELLKEVKASAKRWFIAFLIMIFVEICTVIGFVWYISLPIDEYTIEQDMEDINDSTATQVIGGDYNGKSETENNAQEKSDKK